MLPHVRWGPLRRERRAFRRRGSSSNEGRASSRCRCEGAGARRTQRGSTAFRRPCSASRRCSRCTSKLTRGRAGGFLRPMRKLLMVVGVVVLSLGSTGCGRKRVQVANTPEGNACRRECMSLFNECQGGQRKNRKVCEARETECLTTCPSAVAAEEPSAAAPVFAESEPVAQAAPVRRSICVASELPEWQGASAAEKKQLMEKCRAPAE